MPDRPASSDVASALRGLVYVGAKLTIPGLAWMGCRRGVEIAHAGGDLEHVTGIHAIAFVAFLASSIHLIAGGITWQLAVLHRAKAVTSAGGFAEALRGLKA